ncbi:hypothetical protein [Streptomyces parvus]|uniref:hypothetical protein n=1 Tax=Streptomyces parvus TaxID=66428 RepID=UPI0033E23574
MRYEFGAGIADYVVTPSDGLWAVGAGATVTFWDAAADGTQHTDLLDAAGSPVSQITADEYGSLPAFRGPDGVTGMWADAGGPMRAWMDAHALPSSGEGGGYTSITRIVASATAPADIRAAARWVCDGTADQEEIQAALDDARDNGGGVVQLTTGNYNLTAPLSIEGTDDVDTEIGISLVGQGARATMLTAGPGVSSAIHLTQVVRVQLLDLGITVGGSTHGITSATTNGPSSGHRSFWNSSVKNLQINGPWDGSHTGWALHLGSPFRSVFENIEVGGVGNGVRMFSEHADFNPGDCVISRIFVDIVSDGGIAYEVASPAGTMNQNNWSMAEAHAAGEGCTGILINGSSQRFWGANLEQFDTLVEVASGESNVFDLNYATARGAGPDNRAFVCGAGAYNNTFRAKFLNVAAGDDLVAVEDASTVPEAPNIFEGIRIEANTGSSTTYTAAPSTVLRDIVAFLDGGTVQDGLLQYPGTPTTTQGLVIPAPAGPVSYAIWRAPHACTVTAVRGYREGGSGATINAVAGGADLLAVNLSLATAGTWLSGPGVQNAALEAGDTVAVAVRSVAGSPTAVTILIDIEGLG